jgi:hypothetical protein
MVIVVLGEVADATVAPVQELNASPEGAALAVIGTTVPAA